MFRGRFMKKLLLFENRFSWLTISTLLFTLIFLLHYLYNEIPVVLAVHREQKVVALTFDDGPDPRFTPKVLDILKKEKVRATFFLIGKSVVKNIVIDKRYTKEGQEVGNHTYNHAHLLALTPSQINKELADTNRVILKYIGQEPIWFRPPRRQYNNSIIDIAKKNHLDTVLWNVAMENHLVKTPMAMAKRVIYKVRPGSIILMHDGVLDRTKSVEALPIVIKALKAKGYRFVTLSQLLNKTK